MTTAFWGPVLEHVITGAHAVAAIGGAIVAIHGVIRVFRKGKRRSS